MKDRDFTDADGIMNQLGGWWNPESFTDLAAACSRRSFMKLAGASLALAGLVGCRRPVEKIVPYLSTPEEAVLGKPNYYATHMPFGLAAFPLLVESHEGRPTKIEGNPTHPAAVGGSNVFMQAAILGLYDPDRSKGVLHRGAVNSWVEFVEFWRGLESNLSASGGEGLAILSESFNSPTLTRLRSTFQKRFPKSLWATYEPISVENQLVAIRSITGQDLRPVYHFDQADVILSLDCDFLHLESDSLANARQFTVRRQVRTPQNEMNRLYLIESTLTLTGAMADHRLAKPSSFIEQVALGLAQQLLGSEFTGISNPMDHAVLKPSDRSWLEALVEDLQNHRGQSLILAGRSQPPVVHALTLLLNEALGNFGKTITFPFLNHAAIPDLGSLKGLVQAAQSGQISTLFILGGNPVYNTPADLDFKIALSKIEHSIHLSPYFDETSRNAHWHLNETHFLEGWGDACDREGNLGIVQPLIRPLYGGHSSVELLNLLATSSDRPGYDLVRQTWFEDLLPDRPEERWREALHDGVLSSAKVAPVNPRINPEAVVRLVKESPLPTVRSGLEIVFRTDAKVWDGRFANNAWLQELPDPITKMTWDNAAQVSPQMAKNLGVKSGDVVLLKYREHELCIPVWVQLGVADGSVILSLGYGRETTGSVGNRVGVNAYSLRTAEALYFDNGLSLVKTGASHKFAITQGYPTQAKRPLIHVGRPWFIYWFAPLPNQMNLWPQFRSPLMWDAFAIGAYFTCSALFWYVGMVPDRATLRDRAKTRLRQVIFGLLSLGWRGGHRQWKHFEMAYLILAGVSTPLVLSVHSIVSTDFATSVLPGWHATIFPPYFVAGAIFSGFAMVTTLTIIARKIFRLEDFITMNHFDKIAKIMMATGMMVGYAYAMEFFIAWYSGNPYEGFAFLNRAFGPYAWAYWIMVSCNVLVPQFLWFKKLRSSLPVLFVISILVNVGMWFERFVIIVTSQHRDFLPSSLGLLQADDLGRQHLYRNLWAVLDDVPALFTLPAHDRHGGSKSGVARSAPANEFRREMMVGYPKN